MEKQFDVIALGELLIDFTLNGKSEQGNNMFEANPGGAPCNVLAILQKLGKKTAFIGKVGDDQFGRLLRETIEEAGIDSENLLVDNEINTTLAFVHTFPDGDREFSFYRKPGADMMLQEEEIQEEDIKKAKIFHFGTLSMTHENVRNATIKAVEYAKKNGLLVSLDPNLRPPLWSSLELAKEQMLCAMEYCDILKISDNEIQFVTGVEDYDEGIRIIRERFQIPLVCLTLGKDGSRAYYKDMRVEVAGLYNIKQEKISGGNVYQFLLFFDKLYDRFSDIEKKTFLKSFLEEVRIFEEEQEDGRILKSLKFRFPVFFDGQEISGFDWDNENAVETVVKLVRKTPDAYIDPQSGYGRA